MMNPFKSLCVPSRTFVYLSLLSIILYLIQSASFMGMGIIRVLITKALMIALWAYLLNLVAKSGGTSLSVAWILALLPFMPTGLGIML